MAHHRQHAIALLDVVSDKVAEAQIALSFVTLNLDVTNSPLTKGTARGHIQQATGSLARCGELIVDVLAKLHDPDASVLIEVRRIINSPEFPPTYPDRSLLYYFSDVVGSLVWLILIEPSDYLAQAIRSSNVAWRDADFSLWHINDAITEEA